MSAAEQMPVDEIAEAIVDIPAEQSLGGVALPAEAKQAYAYIKANTQQVVIDHFANPWDFEPIPID